MNCRITKKGVGFFEPNVPAKTLGRYVILNAVRIGNDIGEIEGAANLLQINLGDSVFWAWL